MKKAFQIRGACIGTTMKRSSKDIFIDGNIYTNISVSDLSADGVIVNVLGDVFLVKNKKDIPPRCLWLPKKANYRYSIVNKQIIKQETLPEKVSDIIANLDITIY